MDLGSGATGPPAIADHMLRLGWEDRHSTGGVLGRVLGVPNAVCRVFWEEWFLCFLLSRWSVVEPSNFLVWLARVAKCG